MIPPRLIRTVPAETSYQVEGWWQQACRLHPHWQHITLRDPLDPRDFPLTSPYWDRCQTGAQLAGLVRLEALLTLGGVYIDSDVELFRPLDILRRVPAFAAYEDAKVIPDAVLGAEQHHPAIRLCLMMACARMESSSSDWRTGNGAWSTGPGVTTHVLAARDDVLLLPPGSFYPYHYTEKERASEDFRTLQPWAFGAHHWAASWLP